MNTSQPARLLYAAITELAGSPDDASGVDELLVKIASLVVALAAPIDYASVTAQRDGSPTTVAISSETALAIDEAQYADNAGPCLDALDAAIPVSAVIATTMVWPGFREAAAELGVRASLSVPLFAGSGRPIAALNLYARSVDALAPLRDAVISLFADVEGERPPSLSQTHILDLGDDVGGTELLTGVAAAFNIQHRIHVAIGILMHDDDIPADAAYAVLREQAAAAGRTLLATADAMLAKLAQD